MSPTTGQHKTAQSKPSKGPHPVLGRGPQIEPTALSGAYCVQPPRVGPSPTKNDDIRTRNATNVTQNDIMLKRGKGMSSAPTWIGRKKLPKAAKGAVVSTKKTMIVPCMVINCR